LNRIFCAPSALNAVEAPFCCSKVLQGLAKVVRRVWDSLTDSAAAGLVTIGSSKIERSNRVDSFRNKSEWS
jgi:hypothetical protein